MGAFVVGLFATSVVMLAMITGAVAHVRGMNWAAAFVAGIFFPVTWVVWFLRDSDQKS